MRNAIKEYIEYSSEEKNDLWNTATFVFDTNVFLNLYRYSNKTRNQLIESFECLKPRIDRYNEKWNDIPVTPSSVSSFN